MKDKRTVHDKKADVLKHMTECYAIKTIACRRAKVGRTQFYDWLKTDEEFSVKVNEIEESFVDYVESNLIEMIAMKDRAATMFFLKAKGKSRGY